MSIMLNKASLACVAILIIYLAIHNIERLALVDAKNATSNTRTEITALVTPQPSKEASALFDKVYEQYKKKAPRSKPKNVPKKKSAEQLKQERLAREAKQKGRLNSILAGDTVLRLKAIIENSKGKNNTYHALIEVRNTKTKKTAIEQFDINSELSGFTIVNIKDTEVVMKRTLNNKPQQLTLVMYKS
ncbi:hypothetical protein [Thalassotalea piscium]|uniref:Uncharacterized protein n=1 Tax=Thalassotalea piscium TaxID=1230533 RepID=A0A7X0TT24_9GAMM|nr:hypothetical protein [Thalassotalea piscium]MBB6542761.1 hypothetical protein [Thalassotalea piscium]